MVGARRAHHAAGVEAAIIVTHRKLRRELIHWQLLDASTRVVPRAQAISPDELILQPAQLLACLTHNLLRGQRRRCGQRRRRGGEGRRRRERRRVGAESRILVICAREDGGGSPQRAEVGVEDELVGEDDRDGGDGRDEVALLLRAPQQRARLSEGRRVVGKRSLAREVAR